MKTKKENIFSSKTLSYFLQLAETMSYTQAANILGITQPALTQQIKKLERTVGAPLFYSVGKKLHLSDAGYTMLDATHQIYGILNTALDEIQQSTSATQGEITIGCLTTLEEKIFFDFGLEYYKANKDVKLIIQMLTRKELWERLESNTIDLAVMYLPDKNIKNWKPYETKKVISEKLVFIHTDETMAKRKKVKLKDTIDNNWVIYPPTYYLNDVLTDLFEQEMITKPNCVAYYSKPDRIFNFVKETNTYSALPNSFVIPHNKDQGVYTADFEPAINFDLAFVYRKGKDKIPRIEHLLKSFDKYLLEKDYITRLTELEK
ncbi:LysR family transcriptional regulator [Ligilactobacillus ceti]|uniref:LysR family transcriptional regulator n=1 Tax=Ligilactobacillus ceti DSM 22408 TaxID=1122146 RepID=A0A0R2KHJ1_9LACO|nr:LysR family transcriptional regulator [Ligilactobacillus ceti]KRN88841.1 LysR family transcriptional regulator [Ligilactobacillus ceti DSM 22408]